MKSLPKSLKFLSLALSLVLLLSVFAACANTEESDGTTANLGTEAVSEGETLSPEKQALEDLRDSVDYGKRTFSVLYYDGYRDEVYAENEILDMDSGSTQVINDAVYQRNTLWEQFCNMDLEFIEKDASAANIMIQQEASTASGDFQMISHRMYDMFGVALSGQLYNMESEAMGMNFDGIWWDSGTAGLELESSIFIMTGSTNFHDDAVTYVLMFNKAMANNNKVPDPYKTVKDREWTLDYFNQIIQGVSYDSNGDGTFNELDTYGFVTTWEYGNTFFIGSDLRYVQYDSDGLPTLYLADKMEKAQQVLTMARSIYHDNNATYMSPPAEEIKGLTAFKEGRGMFYGEVCQYLKILNQEMDGDYGVLPVPKYDKAQEYYRTWTHASGSGIAITSAIPTDDAELVGNVVEAYAVLSHQYVKPAYYDIMLTSRNVRDAESAEMLDLIFQDRIYDLAFYYESDFGLYPLFKTAVNDNKDTFTSSYTAAAKKFDRTVARLLKNLQRKQARS